MKLKRTLLGIIFSFSTVGIMATAVDAESYQEVYDQQDQQEKQIQAALDSEFISADDHKLLEKELEHVNEAKENETRQSLRAMIAEEEKQFSKVKERLDVKEAEAAKVEHAQLTKDFSSLEEKGEEPFVVAEDAQQIESLKDELTNLDSTEKVQPIRTLASKMDELSTQIGDNQTQLIQLVDELKELHQSAEELSKNQYVLASDKEALENDEKENAQFFEDADDVEVVESRINDSKALIDGLQTKQQETEQDFKENEGQANELLQSANSLLSKGDLTTEEKEALHEVSQTLSNSLELKDYEPGDLAENYSVLQTKHDDLSDKSNERIAEAKKKAEQEAAEAKKKAEQEAAKKAEKAAQEKAEAKKRASQQSDNNSSKSNNSSSTKSNDSTSSTTVSGGWHQAPAGHKYLKVSSGKTYGQVKNPGNFSLITVEEAAKYSPGHGNGYAKQ